jgi:hypothetical protein
MRAGNQPDLGDANNEPFPVLSKENVIHWPTEQQIQEVSEQLARIQRVGIRSEANGDYFKSGELAYQIQEIIRGTAELLKKSQRANSQERDDRPALARFKTSSSAPKPHH